MSSFEKFSFEVEEVVTKHYNEPFGVVVSEILTKFADSNMREYAIALAQSQYNEIQREMKEYNYGK